MKKMPLPAALILLLLFAAAPIVSCSRSTPEEDQETPQVKPDGENDGFIDIPPEVLEKVHNIYDHASIGPQTVTTVNQLAVLTSICSSSSIQEEGPITVTAAELNGETITLLTLGGTEDVEGQATTMEESQLASFGKPNDYLKAVTKLFSDGTIPEAYPVLITGISLGGMIAQQLLGEEKLLKHFRIEAVITYGSPITLPLDRHDISVIRFADTHDKVPQMGESILRSGLVTAGQMSKKELKQCLDELDRREKILRTGRYSGMIETHALSYIEDPCWSDVDFMGDPSQKNVLILKERMKFYPAPKVAE